IGRADEVVQFRREFRNDKDWHHELEGYLEEFNDSSEPNALDCHGLPDNWKIGRLWYLRAERAVDDPEKPKTLRGQNPLVFYSNSSMALVYYSIGLNNEGYFADAKPAWEFAGNTLDKYGNRDIRTSYGYTIRLNDEKTMRDLADQALADLKKLVPAGAEERL